MAAVTCNSRSAWKLDEYSPARLAVLYVAEYIDGKIARLENKSIDSCPYQGRTSVESDKRIAIMKGWLDRASEIKYGG